MPVCTMPPESCMAQHAMPATVSTAATIMATFKPLPPQVPRLGSAAVEAAETFSVIVGLPYTR